MPIYEYECTACGHFLEKLQKISDPPLAQCPKCNVDALQKLISAAGFRLKGGGWYETDFKQSGEKKRNLVDGGDSGSGAKEGSGKESSAKSEGGEKTSTSKKDSDSSAKPPSTASSPAASG